MRSLILDVETTISNKGNPFDETNKLCYVGLLDTSPNVFSIEYDNEPYRSHLETIQSQIDEAEILDRKSTRLNSSHSQQSRMPSSA